MKKATVQLNVRTSPEAHQFLRQVAVLAGVSQEMIVNAALGLYYEQKSATVAEIHHRCIEVVRRHNLEVPSFKHPLGLAQGEEQLVAA